VRLLVPASKSMTVSDSTRAHRAGVLAETLATPPADELSLTVGALTPK